MPQKITFPTVLTLRLWWWGASDTGFDWAKQHHHVVILDACGQAVGRTALRAQRCRLATSSPAVAVPARTGHMAIETCQGAAVEKLLECDDQHAKQPITFDYQLRPGLAIRSNALKLLEIVGVGNPNEGSLE
jgi:hypothetical protein